MTQEQHFNFWERKFEEKLLTIDLGSDPAHDLAHFKRVVTTSKYLAHQENARFEVVLPAAWLHDLVNVPKNDPRRSIASQLSANSAIEFLAEIEYPSEFFFGIRHAIEAHSFSAQITPQTIEAKIVQDADRLDALGAIGIARCFGVGGMLRRPIYDPVDPFAQDRKLDDTKYTLDHFFSKLFKIAGSLQTEAGKKEGANRVEAMKLFLKQLQTEIYTPVV